MRTGPMAALAALLLLGGCITPENQTAGPPSSVVLPPDAIAGAGDPLRSAIANTSSAFANPRALAGRPADAARSIAQMEFITATLPTDPRFTVISSGNVNAFDQGRAEWRGVLGIPPAAPAQPVINALYAAARALDSGQPAAAALPPGLFTLGGAQTIERLGALPAMPATNRAAVNAATTLDRQQRMGAGRF